MMQYITFYFGLDYGGLLSRIGMDGVGTMHLVTLR